MSDLMGCMKKLVVVSVFLVLSLGVGVGTTTSFVLGQGANMTNSTSMNQIGTNMSAPETDLNAVPGNDTQILEKDTSIGILIIPCLTACRQTKIRATRQSL